MDQDFQNRNDAGFGTTTGNERTEICPTCGHSKSHANLEQFLGRLGITDDMITNLKSHMQNVDVEEYIDTAREYLKTGGDKASKYAKENPGKVAAGVAALAVGAGLLLSSLKKD